MALGGGRWGPCQLLVCGEGRLAVGVFFWGEPPSTPDEGRTSPFPCDPLNLGNFWCIFEKNFSIAFF